MLMSDMLACASLRSAMRTTVQFVCRLAVMAAECICRTTTPPWDYWLFLAKEPLMGKTVVMPIHPKLGLAPIARSMNFLSWAMNFERTNNYEKNNFCLLSIVYCLA